MATTLLNELLGSDFYRVDVEETTDNVAVVPIFHNMGSINVVFSLTPLLPQYYRSIWIVGGLTLNSLILFKSAVAGSGAVGGQMRVTIKRPHSIGGI